MLMETSRRLVFRGAVVARMADHYFSSHFDKKFWLIDPWESERPDYCSDFEAFRELSGNAFHRFNIVRGTAPDAVSRVTAESLSLIHFATGLTDVEIESLDRLARQLAPGGCVFIDGFAWKQGQERAWLDAARKHSLVPLNLMNGQGVLQRPLSKCDQA